MRADIVPGAASPEYDFRTTIDGGQQPGGTLLFMGVGLGIASTAG
jgi:hypothetical protein